MRVVLDTNVLISGLRSNQGSSFALLQLVGTDAFELVLSVPLLLEYEATASRSRLKLNARDVAAVLDYMCAVAVRQPIYFLWRPFLRDPKDDMVLETAFAASASHIVTHNLRDFAPAHELDITAISPGEFLRKVRTR